MANQNYDKRLPSSNAIKKIIDEESLVGQYLEQAHAEIEAEKSVQMSKSTTELRKSIDDINEKRDIAKDKIKALYEHRNIVYENLLSSIIGRFYAKQIVENINNFKKSKTALDLMNPDNKNSELMRLIDEMNDALLTLSQTNVNFKVQRESLMKKIRDLAEKLEGLFDKVKKIMGLSSIEINEEGKLKGLGHRYQFSKDFARGTIRFFKTNKSTNKEEELPDDFDIVNFGEEEVKSEVEIELLKDFLVEDGSEANPYLIKNMDDFERYLNSNSEDNFRLETDLEIGTNNLTFAAGLDGNGHTIRLKSSCRQVSFTGKLSGTLNIIGSAKWYPIPLLYIPIIMRFTIRFGYVFSMSNSAKLNLYMDVSNITPLPLLVHPGRLVRFVTVGTTSNRYAEQFEMFYYTSRQNFSDSSYKVNNIKYERDSIVEQKLNSKTSKFNFNIKKVDSLDFPSTEQSENSIIEKGTIIKLSGNAVLEDGLTFIRATEDVTNQIRYYNNGSEYYVDIKSLKHNYEDSDGVTQVFYPFESITDSKLTILTGDSALDSAGIIKVLASLALIIILKTLNEEKLAANPNTVEETLSILALLRQSLIDQKESLMISLDNYLNLVNGSAQTFSYIEEQRVALDSNYNNTFTENLKTSFSNISGQITLFLEIDNEVEQNKAFEKANNESLLLEQDTINLTIGLVESIVLLNRTIENYLLIFDFTEEYGKKFSKILDETSGILKSLNSLEVNAFTVIPYNVLRQFTAWRQGLMKYTNEGIYGLGQIFIGQEFGLNSIRARLDANDSYSIILKYLVNDSLIRSYKKNLFLGNNKKGDIFSYEEELENNYNIIVHLDANYEQTSPMLLKEIPNLKKYNDLDLSEILSAINQTTRTGTDDETTNLEIGNLIEMIFIDHIFKNSNGKEIKDRIINLFDIFSTTDKIFRNILLEYHFNKLINKIVKLYDSESLKDNFASILTEKQMSIIRSRAANEEKLETLQSLVRKYIAVWMFKDYIYYRAGGSVLRYLEPRELMVYLYRREDYILNAETKEEAFQNFTDSIKNIWNGISKIQF